MSGSTYTQFSRMKVRNCKSEWLLFQPQKSFSRKTGAFFVTLITQGYLAMLKPKATLLGLTQRIFPAVVAVVTSAVDAVPGNQTTADHGGKEARGYFA
jgi:hypothetical protein